MGLFGRRRACDGFGKCGAPEDPKDLDGDKRADKDDPILGAAAWLEAHGGVGSFWFDIYARDRVELRIDEQPVAVVPAKPSVDLSRVEIAVGPKPKQRHAVFVNAPGDWAEAILDAGEKYEVCFARDGLPADEPLPPTAKASTSSACCVPPCSKTARSARSKRAS